MRVEKLSDDIDIKHYLKMLNVDAGGTKILASKARHHLFYINDLHVGAANILKQDALSIGADLAVPRGTVVAKTQNVDGILIANDKQLQALCKKELAQPFGLKELANELKCFINLKMPQETVIMGIINANDDSFFESSRFKDTKAVGRIYEMIEEGAKIIDIGGVSSRPGSVPVDAKEELERIKPIVDILYKKGVHEHVRLSIDSYTPSVLAYVLDRGFSIVNDITGLQDDEVCKLCASYDASAVIMHMQNTPADMQEEPKYKNLLLEIDTFFQTQIEKAEQFGIKDIILDVGIGFGKTLQHNLSLINNLEHFLHFDKPLLIGASRKSMISAIVKSDTSDRLAGTLALHLKAAAKGASIIRVHDVYEHYQALHVDRAIQNARA
jgi:dihydropteroate synthase